MSDFTFLTKEQVFGNKYLGDKNINIFEKYTAKCGITDFAILLGGHSYYNCYQKNIT